MADSEFRPAVCVRWLTGLMARTEVEDGEDGLQIWRSRTADKGFREGANISYKQKLNTLRNVPSSLRLTQVICTGLMKLGILTIGGFCEHGDEISCSIKFREFLTNWRTSSFRGPGELSRYGHSLRAGRSRDRIPVGARFSALVQTGAGAHLASCAMGKGSFSGVKRPGRDVDHPPPSSVPRLKEE